MKLLLITITTLLPFNLFAAGGEAGHGSIAELGYPAINFTILFVFLIYALKKPLREMFDKNADEVQNLYEYAEWYYNVTSY